MGEITLLLEADLSPIAVGNFVALAECGFYDNVIFHRIAYMQDGTPFVITITANSLMPSTAHTCEVGGQVWGGAGWLEDTIVMAYRAG